MSRRRSWSVANRLRLTFGLTAVGLVLAVGLTSDWWLRRSTVARLEALAHEEVDEFVILYEVGDHSASEARALAEKLQSHHPQVRMAFLLRAGPDAIDPVLMAFDPHGLFSETDLPSSAFRGGLPRHLGAGRVAYAEGVDGGQRIELLVDGASVLNELQGYEASLIGLLVLAAALGIGVAEVASRRTGRLLREVAESTRRCSLEHGELHVAIAGENPPEELRAVIAALTDLAAAVRAEIERGRVMTAGLAHELRAPIQNLLGEAEVALMAERTSEEYRATLVDQSLLLQELADSVDNLVTLCRDGDGDRDREPRRERFDLGAEARLRDRRWRQSAESLAVELEFDSRGNLSLVGDREAALRALRNLIANAVNASPAGETVRVELDGTGDDLLVRVEDRGPGIPPAERERIFEPFYRGSTTAGRRAGYGLGLALVQSAVTQHGGTVRIDDREGGGTRIELAFPRSKSTTTSTSPGLERVGG